VHDVIALQKNMSSNSTQHYCNNLGNRKLQCKICSYTTIDNMLLKVHLFRAHKIFFNEDKDYRNGPIWRYFTEEERYTSTCNICGRLHLSGYSTSHLKNHLKGI